MTSCIDLKKLSIFELILIALIILLHIIEAKDYLTLPDYENSCYQNNAIPSATNVKMYHQF
jgi:hypothetical protein